MSDFFIASGDMERKRTNAVSIFLGEVYFDKMKSIPLSEIISKVKEKNLEIEEVDILMANDDGNVTLWASLTKTEPKTTFRNRIEGIISKLSSLQEELLKKINNLG